MSLKAELTTWAAALTAYEAEDFQGAMDQFEQIADTSKIAWNMGIILATLGRHEEAVERFYEATGLDMYFTVAYHQAGMLGKYDAAQKDFSDALLYLRGNQTINYTQLGLDFRLYSAEVLFNCGLSKIYMGQVDAGMQDLREAQSQKQTTEHNVIDDAIRDRGQDYNVFSVPVGVLFRPSQNKLRNLATRDYMGKAVLVAASDASDAYTTFTGITRLRRGQTPLGAPLDAAHPLGRSASVSAIPTADDPPIASRMMRSNTVAVARPTMESVGRPPIGRSNTMRPIQPLEDVPPTLSAVKPLPALSLFKPTRAAPAQASLEPDQGSPQPDPLLQTPQDRSKSLRVTELYDDYYKSPGAYDDDIPPELPPIGGKKIEAWAKKTPPGAAPPSQLTRMMSAKAPPSAFGRMGGGLGRAPSVAASSRESAYREDGTSEAGSYYDMAKVRVKVHFGSLKRGMSVLPTQTYDDFVLALREKFPEIGAEMSVRFKDEDDDMLSMQDEGDFEAAIDVARVLAKGRAEGKLEIWVD